MIAACDAQVPVREWSGVLLPGLVNAHTHLQYTSYGDLASGDLPFPQWIEEVIRRRGSTTDADWAESAAAGARMLLTTGTTSTADDVTDQPAIAPVGDSGVGGISYLELFGYDDSHWPQGRAELEQRLDGAPPGRELGTMAHAIYTLDPGPFADIIRDELNVKQIAWVADRNALVHVSAKANFKTLGKRLGSRMKDVAGAIALLSADAIEQLLNGNTLVVLGETVTAEDILTTSEPRAGLDVSTEQGAVVALDTVLTPELLAEGTAREVVSRIQAARKEAGCEVEDRVTVTLWTDSPELRQSVEAYRGYVAAETLATKLQWTDIAPADDARSALQAGGLGVTVATAHG